MKKGVEKKSLMCYNDWTERKKEWTGVAST